MERNYYIVDAFSGKPYAGNPAGVVLEARGLEESEMQAIAAEFNLSETTFVLPPESPEAAARFRWFTPTTEVSMCGHATIGGVHALVESGRFAGEEAESATIKIETLSGTLTAFVESVPGKEPQRMIWLDMPKPRLDDHPLPVEQLSSTLSVPIEAFESALPTVVTQDRDVLTFVNDVMSLNEAKPDFRKLRDWQVREGLRGLCLATTNTLSPSIHVQSRFFAPAAGVAEDPVTGSVHGPLAAYLVVHGLVPVDDSGLAGLQCVQAKAGGRTGVVYALVQRQEDGGCEVRIGGQAVTTMRGTLG